MCFCVYRNKCHLTLWCKLVHTLGEGFRKKSLSSILLASTTHKLQILRRHFLVPEAIEKEALNNDC